MTTRREVSSSSCRCQPPPHLSAFLRRPQTRPQHSHGRGGVRTRPADGVERRLRVAASQRAFASSGVTAVSGRPRGAYISHTRAV